MPATRVFDSAVHGIALTLLPAASYFDIGIGCGFFCANFLTGPATRRSEFPSRSTGFTAEPRILPYRSLIAFSASSAGSTG